MKEKGPKFRIVGKAFEGKKEQVEKEIEKSFSNHFNTLPIEAQKELKKVEYPKSEKEIALIDFVNKETNKLMQEVGVEPYDVPLENYHIVPPEYYKKQSDFGSATTSHTRQGINFNAEQYRDNPLDFGLDAFHETMHLKGHTAFEIEEKDGKLNKNVYRAGISSYGTLKNAKFHEHFWGLHEAIVSEQEKRMFENFLELPILFEEREWLNSEGADKIKENIVNEKKISKDEIEWVYKNDENRWIIFPYPAHREVLSYVCSEIYKQFSDKYQNVDKIFKEFLKAHFTGYLLTIAKLVEKTFGEESFRLLGNMSNTKESGILHLESLKKMRTKFLKNKL